LNSKVESTQVAMNIYTLESQNTSCKYVNKAQQSCTLHC